MKSLRRLCAVFMLTLAFTLSAFAGEMSTTIASPPPPQGNMSTTVAGDLTTGIADTDSVTEIALNLLQSLLALF